MGIENQVHSVLDAIFHEDQSWIRAGTPLALPTWVLPPKTVGWCAISRSTDWDGNPSA